MHVVAVGVVELEHHEVMGWVVQVTGIGGQVGQTEIVVMALVTVGESSIIISSLLLRKEYPSRKRKLPLRR